MKSNSSIQLSKSWWQKEQPKDLDRAGKAFEDAIVRFTKANAGMRSPTPAAITAMREAVDALEDAGRQVASKVGELEKKAKGDKDLLKDLSNTRAVMEKVLPRELERLRTECAEAEETGDEEETGPGDFADPDRYKAYLKRFSGKLKRNVYSFGLALTSNDPADMRLNLHKTKGGRGLVAQLKKAVPVKKFTFGTAGTMALSQELGGEVEGARTLILHIEGKKIPGLAKRTKLMFRKLGVSAFGQVKIFYDGVEAESADDSVDDVIEDIDLTGDDIELGDVAETPQASTVEPPSAEALRKRQRALATDVADLDDRTRQARLAKALREAGGLIDADRLPDAEKLLDLVEKMLGAESFTGERARPEDEIPFNAVPFTKSRLLWTRTRAKLQEQMGVLENKIREVCGQDPEDVELMAIHDQAHTLSDELRHFDGELEAVLDRLVETGDGPTREQLKQEAIGWIDRYLAVLQRGFFQDVDSNNGFTTVQVTASANAALQLMRSTLEKAKV